MSVSIGYFAARRLLIEGPGDLDSGAWPISWFRIAKGWGMLPHDYWPDQSAASLTSEPPGADDIAKLNRLGHYQRLRSELECLYSVTSTRMTSVTVEITRAWRDAVRGQIPVDGGNLPIAAVHCVALADFDFESRAFRFPNSWGREWGDNGWGSLPFGYLDRFMVEAWTSGLQHGGIQPMRPGIDLRISEGEHSKLGVPWIIDVLDGDKNVVVAWAHLLRTRNSIDVEELFVRPDYRRKGYGTALFNEVRKGAKEKLPLRLWVPWGDHCEANQPALLGWANSVGIKLEPAGVRWAAYRAQLGPSADLLPDLEWTPSKATSPLTLLMERDAETESRWLSEQSDPVDSWTGAKARRRAELVHKKFATSLSAAEQVEFEALQEEFGRYQDRIAPLPSG